MAHVGRSVCDKQIQSIVIAQVSHAAADALFQVERIVSRLQHFHIIVSF